MSKINSFSKFLEWLSTNPWISILSLLFAVIGIALAIIFYIKSRKFKLPCYALRNFNLVTDLSSKIEPLEMFYSGEKIPNLSVTKFAFWNAGNETINSNDIASSCPINISTKLKYKFLDGKIIFVKNLSNNISIIPSNDQSKFNILFEYMDEGDGAVFQFIHTGNCVKDIEVSGKIKGCEKIIRKSTPNLPSFYPLVPLISQSSPLYSESNRMIFILLIIAFVITVLKFAAGPTIFDKILFILFVFGGLFGIGFYIFKSRIPKGFEIFDKDF